MATMNVHQMTHIRNYSYTLTFAESVVWWHTARTLRSFSVVEEVDIDKMFLLETADEDGFIGNRVFHGTTSWWEELYGIHVRIVDEDHEYFKLYDACKD